ncbi:olfactory receptor 52D1-like [Oncorhynchus keta]|uniref:olfactory receptor 52D1-like n=1 Tax=Oncorhynchus keta TaxID=8018 RepID=UPI00227C91EA|nr:olfactory receptor 52D1-like [Oncorhynchus keta]
MCGLRRFLLCYAFYRTLMLRMENVSYVALRQPIVFELEGFEVSRSHGYPLFALVLAIYFLVLLGNVVVMGVIAIDKTLHKPMYVMVCNLAACDLLGGTAVMTQLMVIFLMGEKRIPYNSAYAQAICVHTYGAAVQTILSAMAYDRYVAVCEPLRYHAIMTTAHMVFVILLAWAVAIILIAVLFALNVGTPLCGTYIRHVYCSNRSILNLACVPTPINDIYGLCMTWILSSSSFLIIFFCYAKILSACLMRKSDKGSRSKALQTCASHLVIYLIFEIVSLIIILSNRFPQVPMNIKKFCTILIFIVPPLINPIIYGFVTKELRTSIIKLLKTRVAPKL